MIGVFGRRVQCLKTLPCRCCMHSYSSVSVASLHTLHQHPVTNPKSALDAHPQPAQHLLVSTVVAAPRAQAALLDRGFRANAVHIIEPNPPRTSPIRSTASCRTCRPKALSPHTHNITEHLTQGEHTSIRQITFASFMPQPSSHTVPHSPSCRISTRPSRTLPPPTSLTCVLMEP